MAVLLRIRDSSIIISPPPIAPDRPLPFESWNRTIRMIAMLAKMRITPETISKTLMCETS